MEENIARSLIYSIPVFVGIGYAILILLKRWKKK